MPEPGETRLNPFTAAELEWLTSLKAAIAAGLFNEWMIEPEPMSLSRLDATEAPFYPSDPRDIALLLAGRRAASALI
jgi:hypothetical protein